MSTTIVPNPHTSDSRLADHARLLRLENTTWSTPTEAAHAFADHALRRLAPGALEAIAGKHPALATLAQHAAALRALPASSRAHLDETSRTARLVHRETALLRWDAEDYISWRRGTVVPDQAGQANLATAEETADLALVAYQVAVLVRDCLRTAGYASWSPAIHEDHYAQAAAQCCLELHEIVEPLTKGRA